MTEIESIAIALVKEGYLSQENIEVATKLLTQYLSAADREKFQKVEADSHSQERMILKARTFAEQDAERGNQKNLEVDQAIIQGTFNQDEADLAKLQALEARIAKQAKKATKAMVSAGLVSKSNQKNIRQLIQQVWISE
jgi:uncharacterized protein YdaT